MGGGTRGREPQIQSTIETVLDKYVNTCQILPDEVEWIRERLPISSDRDLVLGYHVGRMVAKAYDILEHRTSEEGKRRATKPMIQRRVPELLEKIETELIR